MKKTRSPGEKKSLSYARDRRNSYSANDKASRTGITRKKKDVRKSYRRGAKTALGASDPAGAPDSAVKEVHRKRWKKVPDAPLGKVVARKRAKREATEKVAQSRRRS